jgi:hypothetical protein
MEVAGSEGRSTDRRCGLEAAAQEAERDFVAARRAWYAGRGEAVPPITWMMGLPDDAPPSVRAAERRYLTARDAWWKVRDQWLVDWDRGLRPTARQAGGRSLR